ncbi:ATPase [Clostridium sp. D2Q-11]|uniref:DNA repair protein RecN n=1 Tax=Anaeromonas frigoriresistens TaxID=2683708 RepID=A0A942V4W0_9FIRM|nr:ATPase [Anaeromonas frigoriresistens]MBS4539912.1 ATPase [Anaeromonas frigoriresistens]
MDSKINDKISLDKYIKILRDIYSSENGKKQAIEEELNLKKDEIQSIDNRIDILEKTNILLQKTSEYAREQAKKQIEGLVTNCLQYIFDENMEFEIEIQELYGKPNAEFYVITKGEETIRTKPEDSRGGGVIDIISLSLRIAFLQIHKPQVYGPLILDEPAKHVSEDYIFNVSEFLKQVSEMFNRQIIMVTHNNHLASIADIAYRVQLSGITSVVSKIEE